MILPRRDALGRRLARSLLPPAVVLDVSFVNGLEAIRSLAAAGAPVIAVDHRQSALGFRSRLAHHVLSPDPMDEEAYVVLPGRARGARVLRAGRRPADARRAARGRGAQRRAPRGLPVARERLGRARAAAAQAPPVRGGRGRGHRGAAHVRGRQRGRGATRPRRRSATRRSSSRAIRSRSSGASAGRCSCARRPRSCSRPGAARPTASRCCRR